MKRRVIASNYVRESQFSLEKRDHPKRHGKRKQRIGERRGALRMLLKLDGSAAKRGNGEGSLEWPLDPPRLCGRACEKRPTV